jgi:phosphohistidine phosphatase
MQLYLLRHGIAVEFGAGGVTRDADRPLTAEGRKKMLQSAAGMRAMGLKFDYIFTSPYLRTRQTTAAVAETFDFNSDHIITLESLAAGRPFANGLSHRAEVFADIGGYDPESPLIVGHMPDLSEMVSVLLTGTGNASIEFKKGSLCALEISTLPPRSPGSLLWMMTPKQLRLVG